MNSKDTFCSQTEARLETLALAGGAPCWCTTKMLAVDRSQIDFNDNTNVENLLKSLAWPKD